MENAHHGTGPVAVIPPDLDADRIRAQLRSRVIGRLLTVVGEVRSTNDVALDAARTAGAEGLAVVADRQTAGRGRRGRGWLSPPGVGLYTSILLRPGCPPARASLLVLVAGLAVVEALREVAGIPSDLKWPNDVLVEGRKAAGILAEMASAEAGVDHAVVGIGINVNHGLTDFPQALQSSATSLYLSTGRRILRSDLAAAVFNALDDWYGLFTAGEFGTILTAARERSAVLGRQVDVAEGESRWCGLALDLDQDGALLVQAADGERRRVLAADVSVRPSRPVWFLRAERKNQD